MPDIHIRSPLAPAECRERLQRAAEDELGPEALVSDMPMFVTIAGNRFSVTNASEDLGWRMFRRGFHGEFVEDANATIVSGRFRLHTLARIGLAIWFVSMGAIVVILTAGEVTGAVRLQPAVPRLAALAIPVLTIAAGAGVVRWSLARARGGDAAVLEFVARLLDASQSDLSLLRPPSS
jgi:hypothetical protein